MKKSELKELIKPVVQECLQEVLLESGLVSKVVSEVMKGMMPILKESKEKAPAPEEYFVPVKGKNDTFRSNVAAEPNTISELKRNRRNDLKEIAGSAYGNLGSMKIGGVNIFEGTQAALPDVKPGGGALSNSDPRDSGVDLSAFGIKGKIKQI